MLICLLHSILWAEKETSQKKSAEEVVIMLGETLLSFVFSINAEQLHFSQRSSVAFGWVRLNPDYTLNHRTHPLCAYLLH